MPDDKVEIQALQDVVSRWRLRNRWADGIEFHRFPEMERRALLFAAHVNRHADVYLGACYV